MKGNQIYSSARTEEHPQITVATHLQALKTMLEALSFVECTIKDGKDKGVILQAAVEALNCVTSLSIKKAAMHCV